MPGEGQSVSQTPVWIWIDGEIRPAAEAQVGVLDHGFLYGDSIYETLRTYHGRIFAEEEHYERLEKSAHAIGLHLPADRGQLRRILQEVAAARPAASEAGLRLIVTRGVGPLGLDFSACQPAVIVIGWPLPQGEHPDAEAGVSLVITSVRRNPPSALDPQIKSGNFLNNILAHREARKRGAFEGVLLTLQGAIAECTTANIFWFRDGIVHTPSDEGILLGVTRARVLKLLERAAMEFQIGSFPADDLRAAEEIFITSTLKGVLPVVSLDGKKLGDGSPGPRTRKMMELYQRETGA